jgi:hypothetical protein
VWLRMLPLRDDLFVWLTLPAEKKNRNLKELANRSND